MLYQELAWLIALARETWLGVDWGGQVAGRGIRQRAVPEDAAGSGGLGKDCIGVVASRKSWCLLAGAPVPPAVQELGLEWLGPEGAGVQKH